MSLTEGLASSCRPARPVPILFMNGTDDPLVPYNGGKGTSWWAADGFWSTPRTVQFWRRHNGCEPGDASSTTLPDPDPQRRLDGDADLLDLPAGARRAALPGQWRRAPLSRRLPDARMRRLADSIFGTQNHDIDGPEVIWQFFEKVPAALTPGSRDLDVLPETDPVIDPAHRGAGRLVGPRGTLAARGVLGTS